MLWSCADLTVIYRQDDDSQIVALSGITLSIRSGERVAIIGPNGSGKSTLALVIAGLIPPTSGVITCDGMRPETPKGAIVFQSPDDNLLGGSVREETQLCIEHAIGSEQLDRKVEDTLSRFGLTFLADQTTAKLSGGEKQTVALACAIVSGRQFIVLDEPTSHLDPPGRRLLWHALDVTLADQETAPGVILVTQYVDEIAHFDRVIELVNGTIRYDGPPSQWKGRKSLELPSVAIPESSEPRLIVSVRNLEQVETPGWALPDNPVHGINLGIHTGEAIGLCGPIGAGKSTLAFLLAGLITDFNGERELIGDQPVMLIQFPERQLFCKTVEDEVAYGLIACGISKSDAQTRSFAALKQVGLPPELSAKRDPFSLSGGQKRRVMLAAASVLESELYILDEPQASLDAEGLSILAEMCRSWLGRGASYLLISHDLVLLRALTSRVLVMDRGALRYDGGWSGLSESANLLKDIGFGEF